MMKLLAYAQLTVIIVYSIFLIYCIDYFINEFVGKN